MSTLQVANIWFDSTSNNRIQYAGSNSYVLIAGNANTLTVNTTGVSISGTSAHTGAATFSNTVTFSSDIVPATSYKRNRIINGNMAVAQRGTTFSTPSGYTLDRWAVGYTGSAPASAAQVAGPTGYKYALQITGGAGNTLTVVYQRVESFNCADLSGNSVTISAVIFGSTAQTVNWNLLYASAADNFTTSTSISTGSWSATTSAQTFTATITGLPSGAANGLQLNIYPANGGAFTSGTVNITGVQLEVGTKATPYEMQIYSDQLAQCQRYYEQSPSLTVFYNCQAYPAISTAYLSGIRWLVPKRAAPTTVAYSRSGTANKVSATATGVDVGTSVAPNATSTIGIHVLIDSGSGFTAGAGYEYNYTANAEL